MARKRYCPVCEQTFEDNNASDQEFTGTCKDAGYKSSGDDGDCSKNWWVRFYRWRKYNEPTSN